MVVIAIVVALGIATYVGYQRSKELEAQGKIVKRNYGFNEYAEIFSLNNIDYNMVLGAINMTDFSDVRAAVYPNNGGQPVVLFKSGYQWNAQLSFVGEMNGIFRSIELLVDKGFDKAGDAIRNKRIDRERQSGKPNEVENLADRFK